MSPRRVDDVLDGALEQLEQLLGTVQRAQRVGTAIGAITRRRQERAQGLAGPIELVEVRPGVYQSRDRPSSRARELLDDARELRDALKPEIPDAVVTPAPRRR